MTDEQEDEGKDGRVKGEDCSTDDRGMIDDKIDGKMVVR